ncbi:hypothetical protein [Litchfieldia alkalitelluris]|nr:hypothetical protein [Litchfieldia alkalitelluris]
MRQKFIEFLWERIDLKVNEIGEEIADVSKLEDLESYLDQLKEVIGSDRV